MRVKCLYNTGKHLHIEKKEDEWERKSKMRLTINKEYIVYGICYHDYTFNYLVYEDTNIPFWYAIELFEIINDKAPNSWHFAFRNNKDSPMKMIWGYDELAIQEGHSDDLLVVGTEKAVKIFHKRKAEIEEEESYF